MFASPRPKSMPEVAAVAMPAVAQARKMPEAATVAQAR